MRPGQLGNFGSCPSYLLRKVKSLEDYETSIDLVSTLQAGNAVWELHMAEKAMPRNPTTNGQASNFLMYHVTYAISVVEHTAQLPPRLMKL